MIIVISVLGVTFIMMLLSTLIIITKRLKEIDQELIDLEEPEEPEEPEEDKLKYKTHYTIEEAKEIDWKNVKFK